MSKLFFTIAIVAVCAAFQLSNGEEALQIVGGNVVTSGFDYAVMLYLNGNQRCGGSLVSSNYVLTAAHCFPYGLTPRGMTVTAVINRKNLNDKSEGVEVKVKNIHEMSQWSQGHEYDVALLELAHPVKGVTFAKLNGNNNAPPLSDMLTVVGWGHTSETSATMQSQLRKVSVPVVDQSTCSKSYPGLGTFNLCAGYEQGGKDACQGDSGGPLVDPSTNIQYGIVSYGKGCAEQGYPGVYTRVSTYHSWITSIIGNSKSDRPTPFGTPTPTAAKSSTCHLKSTHKKAKKKTPCQLPFTYKFKNKKGKVKHKTFQTPPTIAQAPPFDPNAKWNPDDTLWCPPLGHATYESWNDKDYGIAIC